MYSIHRYCVIKLQSFTNPNVSEKVIKNNNTVLRLKRNRYNDVLFSENEIESFSAV